MEDKGILKKLNKIYKMTKVASATVLAGFVLTGMNIVAMWGIGLSQNADLENFKDSQEYQQILASREQELKENNDNYENELRDLHSQEGTEEILKSSNSEIRQGYLDKENVMKNVFWAFVGTESVALVAGMTAWGGWIAGERIKDKKQKESQEMTVEPELCE